LHFQFWSQLLFSLCRSIILSITSDIRTIESEVWPWKCSVSIWVWKDCSLHNLSCLLNCSFNLNDFICRHSLHLTLWDFLGLTGWDMTRIGMNALMYNVRDLQNMFLHTRWFCHEVNSFIFLPFAAFIELVQSGNGTTQRNTEYGSNKDSKPKRMKSSTRGEKKNMSIVPSHLSRTDVSSVTGGSLMFSNMMFCILKNLACYQSSVLLQNFCSIYIVFDMLLYLPSKKRYAFIPISKL